MAIIEACVDSYRSAAAAVRGGADRLELCGQLSIGGVTPSIALFEQVRRDFPIPIRVLIRPRGGDFLYGKKEREQILREIELFDSYGADGIVVGALTEDGDLDGEFLLQVCERAGGGQMTLHRAFDKCRDPFEALKAAKSLGFDTILTSGQRPTAREGAGLLKELVLRAGEELDIMAGGGIGRSNIVYLHETCGINVFHASCKRPIKSKMKFLREEVNMGFANVREDTLFFTDEGEFSECSKIVHGF